ncbi:MAG TPA: class I SAM-dependent methyltransferase [Candidatus Angelobacter sp.]|nr:class I SAM-dependent methyltransferase [Candidatus Angelobacter sp.]
MEHDEKAHWDARYREKPGSWTEPDEFLTQAYAEFLEASSPGLALDLAGGAGRNALFLLRRGWRVKLLDISAVGLQLAREKAEAEGLSANLTTEHVDLNAILDLGSGEYDLVIVFNFLRRELFPALAAALKPGGLLVYKTYTTARRDFGNGPSDRRYLLEPNELREAFSSLNILHYREIIPGKSNAGLVARKP